MAAFEPYPDDLTPLRPLLDAAAPIEAAAETMWAASRNMLLAADLLAAGLAPAGARERELTAEAVEAGVLRALRRDSLLGAEAGPQASASLLGIPAGRGIPGTGYGRMGASVTGRGARAQLYGSIGGAIGYAVGGPVGAVIGGMLGGWLGGGDDRGDEQRRQEELRRQWLNTPEGFEIQAYLYHLIRGHLGLRALIPAFASGLPSLGWRGWAGGLGGLANLTPVLVTIGPGAINITGQSQEAGERAARAFAGELGRALQLNSVLVPAAGLAGDL